MNDVPDNTISEMRMHGLWLVISVAVLLLAFVLENRGSAIVGIASTQYDLPPMCASQRLWGMDCPGCGLTRSFVALAHGDVAAAWRYNAVGLLMFGLFAAQIPYRATQLIRLASGRAAWRPFAGREQYAWTACVGVLTALMLAQWCVRVAWPLALQVLGA